VWFVGGVQRLEREKINVRCNPIPRARASSVSRSSRRCSAAITESNMLASLAETCRALQGQRDNMIDLVVARGLTAAERHYAAGVRVSKLAGSAPMPPSADPDSRFYGTTDLPNKMEQAAANVQDKLNKE
jgi:hypothetical protein